MADLIQEFLRAARERVEKDLRHDYHWERAPKGWLPLPTDMAGWFIATDYGGGGSIGAANHRVLMDAELELIRWRTYGYTWEGGEYAFDPSDEDTVETLSEWWQALANYCLLDEGAYSEIERERFEEDLERWLVSDLLREAESAMGVYVDMLPTAEDVAADWAWEHCYGVYSADDMSYPRDAGHKVACALARGDMNLALDTLPIKIQEAAALAHVTRKSVDWEHGHVRWVKPVHPDGRVGPRRLLVRNDTAQECFVVFPHMVCYR